MRELEHSRLELDVARRPRRVGGPVHASLCAVIVGHPPSTRDLVETQNSSVARSRRSWDGIPGQTEYWPSRRVDGPRHYSAAMSLDLDSPLQVADALLIEAPRLVRRLVASLQQVGTNLQAERFIRIRRQAARQARAYRTARDAVLLACEPH
jgi:hypothetical protein